MAIVKMSTSKSAARLFNYLKDDVPHHGHDFLNGKRNLETEGINCSQNAGSALHEMREVQKTYAKEKGYTQTAMLTVSFTKDDIDPANPFDHEKGMDICRDLQAEIYGENHQSYMFAQADNESGLFHVHMVNNAVGFDGKSVRGKQRDFKHVAEKSNEIFKEHDLELVPLVLDKEERVTSKEVQMRRRGSKPWKDEMRERVDAVMFDEDTYTYGDFQDRLARSGVRMERGKRDIEYKMDVEDGAGKVKTHSLTARNFGSDYKEDDIRESLREKKDDRDRFIQEQYDAAQQQLEQSAQQLEEYRQREQSKREERERKRVEEQHAESERRREAIEQQRKLERQIEHSTASTPRRSSKRTGKQAPEIEK